MTLRVAVAFITRNDDVLIIRRVSKEPGLDWCLPGGKLDEGEDLYAATIREVLEETDITVQPLTILGEKPHPLNPNITLVYVHCDYVSGTAKVLEPEKHTDIRWVKAAELANFLERDYKPFVHEFFQEKVATLA